MAQMNISVPDKLKAWAETRVAEGDYSSTSDYVRDLMRRDHDRRKRVTQLQALIDEGLASPPSGRSLDEILAEGLRRVA